MVKRLNNSICTLEAQTEAGMGARTPAAGVDVPPQMGLVHLATLNLGHQLVVALLTDAAADDLTDLREQHVSALHRRTRGDGALVADGGLTRGVSTGDGRGSPHSRCFNSSPHSRCFNSGQ